MYLMGSYPTPDGERQVLLLHLPSNNDELAVVDVPTGPGPLEYQEIYIVSRDVESLDAAARVADDHLARSAERGEPATGDSYLSDAARIASMQRALGEAA
jgi:hypothetical protein